MAISTIDSFKKAYSAPKKIMWRENNTELWFELVNLLKLSEWTQSADSGILALNMREGERGHNKRVSDCCCRVFGCVKKKTVIFDTLHCYFINKVAFLF